LGELGTGDRLVLVPKTGLAQRRVEAVANRGLGEALRGADVDLVPRPLLAGGVQDLLRGGGGEGGERGPGGPLAAAPELEDAGESEHPGRGRRERDAHVIAD